MSAADAKRSERTTAQATRQMMLRVEKRSNLRRTKEIDAMVNTAYTSRMTSRVVATDHARTNQLRAKQMRAALGVLNQYYARHLKRNKQA